MFSYKKLQLLLVLGMIAPVSCFASNFCIAVAGGFGSGGTTFIGTGFATPAKGSCEVWAGFAKTAATVVLSTTGSGCLSSDGKVLTFSLSSVDPDFLGVGVVQSDYILLCPGGASGCPIGSPRDVGSAGGIAASVTCTSSLLHLPASHP